MDTLKEIPQREWEDYVQYRDRMTVLEKSPTSDSNESEWADLTDKVYQIEQKYDKEYLDFRYDESLKK